MVVGAAGDQPQPLALQRRRQRRRILDDLPLVGLEFLRHRLAQRHRLGGDDVHERAALSAGEDGLVDGFRQTLPAEDHAAPGTPQGFVGGGGDHVGIGDGRGVYPRCHQTGDVCHIHHQIGARLVGDLPAAGEVDDAGIGAGAHHDQLGVAFQCDFLHGIIVDALGHRIHAVGHDMKILAGNVHRGAVGQMPALGQIHAHHRVSGIQQRKKHRQIGVGAGMGLHIGVLGAEQLHRPLPGDILHHIHILAAAVIPLAGIALGVFVGEYPAGGQQHRLGYDVFGGDQLDVMPLPLQLILAGSRYLRVVILEFFKEIHGFVPPCFNYTSV